MKSGRALSRLAEYAMRAGSGKTSVGAACLGMLVVMLFCATDVMGQATRPTTRGAAARPMVVGPARATAQDGLPYRVERFELAYLQREGQALTAGLPTVDELMQIEVELGRTQDGYVSPRLGLPTVRFRLANAPRQMLDRYYQSALQAIDMQIVRYFNRKGIIGVFVAQSETD